MTKKKYFFTILILGLLTTLGPFSIDMYLPGFDAIARDFHTTKDTVSYSLASYFIGLAFGQLLYGPLLDKYGRKTPLYFGLAIYIIASFGCMFAAGINMLIALRFVQALGSCAAAVAAVAMVRDLFPVSESAKVFALLMLVVGASPMIAPAVGGYVTGAFGWHAVFLILAIIAALTLVAVVFFLPDKYIPNSTLSLKPKPIIKGFWVVLKDAQFSTYSFAGAFAFSGLFAYVAASTLIFYGIYHVSEHLFGWIFAALSIGFIGSNQVNSLLLRRFTSQQIVPFALVGQLVIGLIFVCIAYSNLLTLPLTMTMLFLMLCCVGLTSPNTSALSIAPFEHNAGSASALMGAIQLGIGAVASAAVSSFKALTVTPVACIISVTALLSVIIFFAGRRNIKVEKVASVDAISIH